MIDELPTRKPNRLKNYDYSSSGRYFITICTAEKQCLLSEISAVFDICDPYALRLTAIGNVVKTAVEQIPVRYPSVQVENYVIMPNHVHLLLLVGQDCDNRIEGPSVQTVIGHFKRAVSMELGSSIWQKGFHDHVIRSMRDYERHWNYIDSNPIKWVEDEYYPGRP